MMKKKGVVKERTGGKRMQERGGKSGTRAA